MEFTDVIEKRYSCKNYSARKVEDEKLTAILSAGRVAPTAKNFQEQRIYVVRSEEGPCKDRCGNAVPLRCADLPCGGI